MNYATKSPVFFEPDASFKDLSYTYSFDKYSCIAWVYPFHIMFAYLVGISGFLALISRVIDRLRPYHLTFGRWYLIFMLWCMASSLVIYTTGLPMPILVSFLYLLFSITIGWNAIHVHAQRISQQVKLRVNERIKKIFENKQSSADNLQVDKIENEEKGKILMSKSFSDRLFSWRMLHGVMMTFSWCQMVGRTFVTNPFKSFQGCWAYPAYKSMDGQVYAVDGKSTPPFPMEKGKFLVLITVPTVCMIIFVTLVTTFYYYKKDQKKKNSTISSSSSSGNGESLVIT